MILDVSSTLISKVTDTVKKQVIEWKSQQLDKWYLIVYIGCIVMKVR